MDSGEEVLQGGVANAGAVIRVGSDVLRYGSDPNDRDAYRSGKADLIRRITSEELGDP